MNGSDGTRTRDLRRDRPEIMLRLEKLSTVEKAVSLANTAILTGKVAHGSCPNLWLPGALPGRAFRPGRAIS
jgi:hypothetical protein